MNDLRGWVERWQRLEPVLEKIETEELRAADHRETIRQILQMCDWCLENTQPRKTSGLVEQQRLFAKMITDAE